MILFEEQEKDQKQKGQEPPDRRPCARKDLHRPGIFLPEREGDSHGQIDQFQVAARGQSETDGLPFGGKLGEGEKGSLFGLLWIIHEQGDGRLHARIGGKGKAGGCIGRSLDQDGVWLPGREFGQ